MATSELFREIWAKTEPVHPLYCHMIDVGSTALALLATTAFQGVTERFCIATGCPEPSVPAWMAYLAALHDIGKCHPGFQSKGPAELIQPLLAAGLPCPIEPGYRHEAVSGQYSMHLLKDVFGWEHSAARTVAEAIRGHHGDFRVDDPLPDTPKVSASWEPLRSDLAETMRSIFKPRDWRAAFGDHSTAGVLLAGLIVLSDWIASNAELFPMGSDGLAPENYARISRERANAAVRRLAFDTEVAWPLRPTFAELWPGMAPRPIQSKCEELCQSGLDPGLMIIEAPMGEGKTEAAIYLAAHWLADAKESGLYFALPTAATSNQMHGRVGDFIRQRGAETAQGVRLVHGMAWLVDEATPVTAPDLPDSSPSERGQAIGWFWPKKRSLLASYGVGTIDQVLLSVLHVKHGFLRLFGLAGKVLVVDEVHAYDAYMTEILELLLKWCRALRIPVVLLSATLPAKRRAALVRAYNPDADGSLLAADAESYPLLTYVSTAGDEVRTEAVSGSAKRLRVTVIAHPGLLNNPEDVARLVADRAGSGGCHCVIANTVRSAQVIHRALKHELQLRGDIRTDLMLFHARFPAGRRQEIEHRALCMFDKRSLMPVSDERHAERPQRAILVATQVVEQSLDLDFDEMFSEIAPIDLLLQRVGRLHRHDGRTRQTGPEARLHVLLPSDSDHPDFGNTERVYGRYILLQTLEALAECSAMALPDDIRGLIERVYQEPKRTCEPAGTEPSDLLQTWADLQTRTAEDQDKAKHYLIPEPNAKRFGLAVKLGGSFEEDEGDAATYFTAKTRLGDSAMTLLLVEGGDFSEELAKSSRPSLPVIRRMMENTASVPAYWLAGAESAEGYQPPEAAPQWLPGVTVLRTVGGDWCGTQRSGGKRVRIRYDTELGLTREVEEVT